jgi:hypothetical protein
MEEAMKMKRHPISVQRSDTVLSILFTGICAASTGFLAAFLALNFYFKIVIHENNIAIPNIWQFYGAATLAALLTGSFMWWHFVTKPGQYTLKQGIMVGIITSIIAHPVAWLLAGLITYFGNVPFFTGFIINSPFDVLFVALFVSMFSLLYVGWLTALVGGIAGALFIRAQRADEHA